MRFCMFSIVIVQNIQSDARATKRRDSLFHLYKFRLRILSFNKPKPNSTMVAKSTFVILTLAGFLEVTSAFSHLPLPLTRRSLRSKISCQITPKDELAAPIPESPKSVASGGTDYSTLPKKEITPLFLIPSSSVVGKGDLVGDLGFDPLGLATVSTALLLRLS